MINGNVQNDGIVPHPDFPRFCRFARRSGPDTGAILTQNVIPVICVQPIRYQLLYGAFFLLVFFSMVFSINYTIGATDSKATV